MVFLSLKCRTSFSLNQSTLFQFTFNPFQCDQIGRFLKVLGYKFVNQSSPKGLVTFGGLQKRISLCENFCFYYLGNFYKHLGYLLTPTSGHNVNKLRYKNSIPGHSRDVHVPDEVQQVPVGRAHLQVHSGKLQLRRYEESISHNKKYFWPNWVEFLWTNPIYKLVK